MITFLALLPLFLSAPPPTPCICPQHLTYVCGTDGKTYQNVCYAICGRTKISHFGKCKAKPTSQPTSKPSVWKAKLPKWDKNMRICMINTVSWAKFTAEKITKYANFQYYKRKFPNMTIRKVNGVPLGKLWLDWFKKHKNDKSKTIYFMMAYFAYKFLTTPPPQDSQYKHKTILLARQFCLKGSP